MASEPSAASGCQVDLKGQTALVTGASRGIGRAIAERLAACGASVALVARSAEGLQGTVEAIRSAGGTAEPFPGDVSKSEDVQTIVEAVEQRFETIEVLVNNAGITKDMLMLRMEDEAFRSVIETNLYSAFYFTKAIGSLMMRKRYGRIINIASVAGLVGNPGQANYSASKAGLIGFTRTVAKELASRNITVNAVAPGFVETDMTDALPDKVKQAVREHVPMKGFGKPEDIADLVAYLAGPGARYLTGQVIAVDGGMTA